MTPVCHSFFGFSAGFALFPLVGRFGISRRKTVALSTFGSVLPDVDAIWLVLNRDVYFGLNWYSHHGITHSIIGAFFLACFFSGIVSPKLFNRPFRDRENRLKLLICTVIIFIGCLIHLPGDLVTLPGSWGGIPLLAPFSWERFGGWAHMPWKDYYLIVFALGGYAFFLFMTIVEVLVQKKFRVLPAIVAIGAISWGIVHIYTSKFINYQQWDAEQKILVGDEIFARLQQEERKLSRLWHINTLY